MIKIKGTGAIIILVIAVFFLSNGQCAVCGTEHKLFVSVLDNRPQSNSVGISENFDTRSLSMVFHSWSWVESKNSDFLISQDSIKLTDVAIVYSNITTTAHMVAINNNSVLNAKVQVYVIAIENITVNGFHITSGTTKEWVSPLPSFLGITFNETYFQVRLRQVNSLNDIPDDDRPTNATKDFTYIDLIYTTLAGIPSTLASLLFWIVVLVMVKSQHIKEGLDDGI